MLKSYGELPDNIKINETEIMAENEEEFDVDFNVDDI